MFIQTCLLCIYKYFHKVLYGLLSRDTFNILFGFDGQKLLCICNSTTFLDTYNSHTSIVHFPDEVIHPGMNELPN